MDDIRRKQRVNLEVFCKTAVTTKILRLKEI